MPINEDKQRQERNERILTYCLYLLETEGPEILEKARASLIKEEFEEELKAFLNKEKINGCL